MGVRISVSHFQILYEDTFQICKHLHLFNYNIFNSQFDLFSLHTILSILLQLMISSFFSLYFNNLSRGSCTFLSGSAIKTVSSAYLLFLILPSTMINPGRISSYVKSASLQMLNISWEQTEPYLTHLSTSVIYLFYNSF